MSIEVRKQWERAKEYSISWIQRKNRIEFYVEIAWSVCSIICSILCIHFFFIHEYIQMQWNANFLHLLSDLLWNHVIFHEYHVSIITQIWLYSDAVFSSVHEDRLGWLYCSLAIIATIHYEWICENFKNSIETAFSAIRDVIKKRMQTSSTVNAIHLQYCFDASICKAIHFPSAVAAGFFPREDG